MPRASKPAAIFSMSSVRRRGSLMVDRTPMMTVWTSLSFEESLAVGGADAFDLAEHAVEFLGHR
jgi:hypothetical protein